MSALFGRKIVNLEELKALTKIAKQEGHIGTEYEVTKEIYLGDEEFRKFAGDFLKDQPWINKDDGGANENGQIRCIRVVNQKTGERILVNNEGYDYPRYTAIE